MKYVLGIDGGGTKTAYTLADLAGNIIARYQGPTIHYMQTGYEDLTATIHDNIDFLINDNNLAYEDIIYCFIGAAGFGDISEDEPFIKAAIEKGLNEIPFTVKNDTYNAHAGALLGSDGICVIAGTGSIGLGVNGNSSVICGGWHHAFGGDEGSAHWIAEKYIQTFTKQSDFRMQRTKLYSYTKEKYQFKDDSDILQKFVVDWKYDRTKIASLSKDIYDLARLNDPAALAIFEEAAYELSLIYKAIYRQLNFSGIVSASYVGGVFQSQELILDPLRRNLTDIEIDLIEPAFAPDIGSVLLAYKECGIAVDETIEANLRR